MTSKENRHLAMTPNRWFAMVMEVMNRKACATALDAADAPARLLEIGFGSGGLIAMALKRWPACAVAGIDPTADMIKMARARFSRPAFAKRVELRRASADAIPFAPSCFDAVVAVNSFQFWSPPERAMSEVARVLKPGGRLVMALRRHDGRAPDWLPNPISRSGAEVEGARALVAASGFSLAATSGRRHGVELVVAHKR